MATAITRNARGGIDKLSSREAQGTVARGSTGALGSSSFQSATPIPATDLNPIAPIKLPPAPTPTDPGNVVDANNAALAPGMEQAGYTMKDGAFSYTPPKGATDTAAPATDLFSQYLSSLTPPASTADIYANVANSAGLQDKQDAYSKLSARLNSITNNRDAAILKLEGDNARRDVTKNIYSGQVSRINREAAIQALPVQAQLAAAQGDLAMAQQHVDTMFAIKSQDAQAQYAFRSKVLDAVYNFADKQEQRKLDAVQKAEDRKYAEQQDFLKTQRNLLASAVQQGAPASVIEGIGSASSFLDVISAAGQYGGDILARQIQQAQLRKLNEAPAPSDTKAPEVKNINGVDMQWNPQTGKWETISAGAQGISPKDEQTLKSATDTLSKVDNLMNHPGFNSSVGPFSITRVPLADAFGNKQDFIASVENLVSQQTLNALTDLKARGGTLGALSEKELKILESTASKISSWRQLDANGNITGYNTSEGRFKDELKSMQEKLKQAQIDVLGYDPSLVPTTESSIIDMYVTNGSTPSFNPASVY